MFPKAPRLAGRSYSRPEPSPNNRVGARRLPSGPPGPISLARGLGLGGLGATNFILSVKFLVIAQQNSAIALVALAVVGRADAATHTISWGFINFNAGSITVQVGDTVVWGK